MFQQTVQYCQCGQYVAANIHTAVIDYSGEEPTHTRSASTKSNLYHDCYCYLVQESRFENCPLSFVHQPEKYK